MTGGVGIIDQAAIYWPLETLLQEVLDAGRRHQQIVKRLAPQRDREQPEVRIAAPGGAGPLRRAFPAALGEAARRDESQRMEEVGTLFGCARRELPAQRQ